jgi:hypothetical protein
LNELNATSTPPELLERILELAGTEMVLVGGQALAFWAAYYRTSAPALAVTKDVDLLGTRRDAQRLARGLDARVTFPRRRDLTLLTAQVVKDLPGNAYVSIDVLSRVYGKITPEAIMRRSILAETPVGTFRVMHPLDVLQGRLENVHGLAEKRDEHGIAQLELAIRMTREFLRDVASREGAGPNEPRPVMLRHVARLEVLALSDPGRKTATRHAVHVADAIDPAPLLHVKPFVARKLPQLLKLMSSTRRAELAPMLARQGGQ